MHRGMDPDVDRMTIAELRSMGWSFWPCATQDHQSGCESLDELPRACGRKT
jgi:hypothetical protein